MSTGGPQLEQSTFAMQASPSRPPEPQSAQFPPKEDVAMLTVMHEMNMMIEERNLES